MLKLLFLTVAALSLTAAASAQVGGIAIDAEGVVRLKTVTTSRAAVASARRDAETSDGPLNRATARRFVSLRSVLNDSPDTAAATLAGLVRIDLLLADEAAADIYLAGPAEPLMTDAAGRPIGLDTGRAAIRRDHLIEAFRHVAGGGGLYGCSIDPTPEGFERLNTYLRRNSAAASAAAVARRYPMMARALGVQNVSVFGVPADSQIAVLAVEADLIMKELALGLRKSGVRGVPSHLSLIRPDGNNLQRWWFAPNYEAITADPGGRVFELSGPRLKVLAQDEIVGTGGVRHDAALTATSTQQFAVNFSDHMDAVAARQPAIAALQNTADLLVVAELIRGEGLAEVGFDPLAAAAALPRPQPAETAPQSVPSRATTRRVGRFMLGLVGGVTLDPSTCVRDFAREGRVDSRHPAVDGLFADSPADAGPARR